mmetsp:Transcript_18713/g.27690  ORF Transcript_18713/g.27690 Transcript_18713/m.27690 type:complete len:88 (+) Transcript_18713:23-286(+)
MPERMASPTEIIGRNRNQAMATTADVRPNEIPTALMDVANPTNGPRMLDTSGILADMAGKNDKQAEKPMKFPRPPAARNILVNNLLF